MDNTSLDEKIIFTIHKYYDDFKKFMLSEQLPEIEIKRLLENNVYAKLNHNDLIKGRYILNINIDLFKYNEKFIKSILFHEFTHIHDFYLIHSNFTNEETLNLMTSYSEYNASRIELISQFGIDNIKSITKRFSNNFNVVYKNETIKIDEYVIYPLASAMGIIESERKSFNNLSDFEYAEQFVTSEKFMMYSYGKLDAANKYLDTPLPDIYLKNKTVFYHELEQLHNILNMDVDLKMRYHFIKEYLDKYQFCFYNYFIHNTKEW